MRIAYTFYDRPNYTAGPRINALRVLPELVRRGHEVTALIGYKESCPAREILQSRGVNVLATPFPKYIEDQVAWFYRSLTRVDPDIFVPNISVSGAYAARYCREAGRPTIAGHRSDDKFNWGMAERFCRISDAWAVSGLFCMGAELGDKVRAWGSKRTRVVDIASGVPIPAEQVTQANPLCLVYAGRLEERQKRISEVTEAVCDTLERFPDATAKMIGDGSRKQHVADIISHRNLDDRITLTGYVDPENVQDEMADGNILVLLSDFEGVPGAVMEGMACGLVPVCLDIPGGLRELVIHERTGLLVRDRGASFQDAICRLARDDQLRIRLSRNARQYIKERFSLHTAVDLWEALFEDLLKTAGPRKPLRFPRRPNLPKPFAPIAREDKRRPTAAASAVKRVKSFARRALGMFPNRVPTASASKETG